ncbi:MAG: hypothetical protein QUV05_19385 [Phycisphaerae bacterium]|nr:hypothetical protein [Phycisphaerae bacterium]
MKRCTLGLATCTAVFASASSVHAALISMIVDPMYGSTDNTGATALIQFSFTEDGSDDLLVMAIHNTTPISLGSKLTAVGFEWPASLALPLSYAEGGKSVYFDELDFHVRVSPRWLNAAGGYDVMITSDGNFEGGNSLKAPGAGETQSIILNLGNTGLTPDQLSATLSNWYADPDRIWLIAKFQAVDDELSDKVASRIPEPAGILLLGVSQLSLWRKRRTRSGR